MLSRREFTGSFLAAPVQGATRDIAPATLTDVSASVRARKVSPIELTRFCLDRIQKQNGYLNAFITIMADSALAQAKALDAEIRSGKWRGPLHGVPIAVKDLFDTAGVRTTAASQHWSHRVPSQDAAVVRRLKDAGAVLVGKANMDEFAYNYTGETSAFGTSRNPWNTRRTPGGSSGGSAVAVAAGMCFGALGSDTGGSIRLPAAFCGITGFKPTWGAVSLDGVAPLAWSLDHAGPMCRTARDAAVLFEAMTGKSVRDSAVSVQGLRLGIPRFTFFDGLDAEVEEATGSSIRTLAALTSGVKDVRMPPLPVSKVVPDLPETYIRIIAAEAYAFHEQMARKDPNLYNPGTLKSIRMGAPVTAAEYIRARREMDRLRADPGLFADVDLVITPTAPGPAFLFGEGRLVFLRNTAPWNLLGLPAISIPCGFTKAGLPIGLQITGPAGRDDAVLALAAAYQNTTDWHKRQPTLRETGNELSN